jgi:hypothetical protein
VNSAQIPWADAKPYHNVYRYYYSFVGDNSPSLRLITRLTKTAEINYYVEFLYDTDGKMIYFYEKQNDQSKFTYREFKAFFEKDLCVNIMVDKEVIDIKDQQYNPKVNGIKILGGQLVQRFMNDMQSIKP